MHRVHKVPRRVLEAKTFGRLSIPDKSIIHSHTGFYIVVFISLEQMPKGGISESSGKYVFDRLRNGLATFHSGSASETPLSSRLPQAGAT